MGDSVKLTYRLLQRSDLEVLKEMHKDLFPVRILDPSLQGVSLHVLATNNAAIALYKKLSFKRVWTFLFYYPNIPNDDPGDQGRKYVLMRVSPGLTSIVVASLSGNTFGMEVPFVCFTSSGRSPSWLHPIF
ncbi:unnamed protein product [Cuscuta epithymum]|uniref:histone acetyltransferase n=1 Tax=Cuscuta epithymum TaxID=186058 RepID=A0AAV0CA15_9ASTE|nr:unnamed protein product [Cuscuta epithymum]